MDPLCGADALPSALGPNHHPGGVGIEGLGDQFFRNIRTVRVGGIDEVDAQFNRAAQGGECRRLILGRAPDSLACNAHGSIAQTVHSEVAAQGDGSGGRGRDGLGLARAK